MNYNNPNNYGQYQYYGQYQQYQYGGQNPGPYNYYQNLYNMFGGYNPILDRKAKELRRLSVLCGCAALGFTLAQYLFAFLLSALGLYDSYATDSFMQIGLSALAPFLYIVIPFSVIYFLYKPHEKESVMIFEKPRSIQLFVLAIFAGLMVCFVGDLFTGFVSQVFYVFGIEFGGSEMLMPKSVMEYILFVIAVAVVPALVEEMAFRGIIMQPLRKFGDGFAIVMSSLVFALLHGNMVQIPFAFVSGLALGYFQIATGSIWTSVVIHFLNNLISVITSIYYDKYPDAPVVPYLICSGAIIIIGIIAMIVFMKSEHTKLEKDKSELGKSLKASVYLCTPPMVITIFIAISMTFTFSEIKNALGLVAAIALLSVVSGLIIQKTGSLRKDSRIKCGAMYTASLAISIIFLVIGVFSLFISAIVV